MASWGVPTPDTQSVVLAQRLKKVEQERDGVQEQLDQHLRAMENQRLIVEELRREIKEIREYPLSLIWAEIRRTLFR